MTRGLNPKGDALRTARARPSVASTGGTVSVRPVFPAGIGALVTVRPGFPHRELGPFSRGRGHELVPGDTQRTWSAGSRCRLCGVSAEFPHVCV